MLPFLIRKCSQVLRLVFGARAYTGGPSGADLGKRGKLVSEGTVGGIGISVYRRGESLVKALKHCLFVVVVVFSVCLFCFSKKKKKSR